ncbi:hypothetical protein V6N13_097686 [Hibiscus sabdariffa]
MQYRYEPSSTGTDSCRSALIAGLKLLNGHIDDLTYQNGPDVYAKVSSCESAKEVWDKLEVIHEGTNDVKETKIGLLNLEYENFKMDPNEDIKSMFDRFSTIVNQLKGFGEEIPEDKLIRKGKRRR